MLCFYLTKRTESKLFDYGDWFIFHKLDNLMNLASARYVIAQPGPKAISLLKSFQAVIFGKLYLNYLRAALLGKDFPTSFSLEFM